jgi:hypothetical protein
MNALKLSSVLQKRMAIPLYSLSFPKKFSIRCRHLYLSLSNSTGKRRWDLGGMTGLRSGKRKLDVEALVRAMVFNRLCAPDSKLGCLRWLETVALPAMPAGVTHQHLLRAMDALMDNADRVEKELAKQIRPLVDRDLAVVFYDLTAVRIHGEGTVEDDIRAFGMNKEVGGIARQFVLGVVQTAEGLPLMHTVHPGNVAETKTLQAMLATVLERFPIQRVILVADRGLLSL